ncbi:unnamed protein product [Heterobilharzia americana]|nr:unnamed protein product [Heterobilharzia americana]
MVFQYKVSCHYCYTLSVCQKFELYVNEYSSTLKVECRRNKLSFYRFNKLRMHAKKVLTIFMILFLKTIYCVCAWYLPNHLIHNGHRHDSNAYPSTYGSKQMYTDSTKYDNDEPTVNQVKTVQYRGSQYMLVIGLKLPYYEADSYCNQAFMSESHLTSVQSDDEWKVLSRHFGSTNPTEIWLGGVADLVNSQYVILRWLDGTPFQYHRFSSKEKEHWQKTLQKSHQGCIVGEIQNNGQGNWYVQPMPCDEPKGFICKETNFGHPMKPWHVSQSKSRKSRLPPPEPHYAHQYDEPPFGVFPLSMETYKPKSPIPKSIKPIISRVSNEQRVTPQTIQTKAPQVQQISQVQQNLTKTTATRTNTEESKPP